MLQIHCRPIVRGAMILALFGFVAASGAHAQDDILFLENFDAVEMPSLPAGWVSAPAGVWTSSGSVAGPGSGANNLVVSGGDSGSVLTPIIDFSQVLSGSIRYTARRTSTFDLNNLIVEASIDGGATFTIVVADSGAAVPSATSTYEDVTTVIPLNLIGEPAVQFRIRALGNSGGNCRIDDVSIEGTGSVSVSSLGFGGTSTGLAHGDTAHVGLDLTILDAVVSLHGIQFDLNWSDSLEVVGIVRGSPISDTGDWEVASRLDTLPGRVVILNRTATGLPAGTYADVVKIVAVPLASDNASPRSDALAISGIIGSRSEDTGDDAFVTGTNLTHVISVSSPAASFEVSDDTLDFGLLAPDSVVSKPILVSNVAGNTPLTGTASSGHPAIEIVPVSYSIDPGDSLEFFVSVDAAVVGSGPVEGALTFVHNAVSSPDTVIVHAVVGSASTRGDVNDDGFADLVDLVLAIDHVVGHAEIDPAFVGRVDLHPFPNGDSGVDVRDLTVLVKAINQGIWPDGVLLALPGALAKGDFEGQAQVVVDSGPEASQLTVRFEGGLRAVQLILTKVGGLHPSEVSTAAMAEFVQVRAESYHGGGAGLVSVLGYSLDGAISEEDAFSLATITRDLSSEEDSLLIVYGAAVDLSNRRVELDVVESLPDAPFPDFGAPFPQPMSLADHGRLFVPSKSPGFSEVHFVLTDVLGRMIHKDAVRVGPNRPFVWDVRSVGHAALVPGLYFLTLSGETGRRTLPVVVVP